MSAGGFFGPTWDLEVRGSDGAAVVRAGLTRVQLLVLASKISKAVDGGGGFDDGPFELRPSPPPEKAP